MKIIVSHDIDHLTVKEHLGDLIIPKSLVRATVELVSGTISFREYYGRYGEVFTNKYNYIDEIIDFNDRYKVQSTFFIGVNNGLGLNYTLAQAGHWIKRIMDRGYEIGVHGIDFDSPEKVKKEYELFRSISGKEEFGVRMHYLRKNEETLSYLERSGYRFDSTVYETADPYKIGRMWEFPLHLMETYFIQPNGRWQSEPLPKIKERTLKRVDEILKKDLRYFTVLFHDRYYTGNFKSWFDWYNWFIDWLSSQGFEFISYKEAVKELEA